MCRKLGFFRVSDLDLSISWGILHDYTHASSDQGSDF